MGAGAAATGGLGVQLPGSILILPGMLGDADTGAVATQPTLPCRNDGGGGARGLERVEAIPDRWAAEGVVRRQGWEGNWTTRHPHAQARGVAG